MWLAQRKVQRLRHEMFAPGMHCPRYGEDYQSLNVMEIREQLGDFIYDDEEYELQLGKRTYRPLTYLENQAQYEGEWL